MAISIPTIQGGTRLVFDSVQGITNVVEGMHETIARRPLPWTPKPLERGRSQPDTRCGECPEPIQCRNPGHRRAQRCLR
jgi:hypothetical protein